MGARPGTGLGQPRWLQTSPKDPPVGKKNQVWQRARLASSSDLQRPAPQGPVPLPPTELEARRRLRPRAHGVRSGFALPAPGRWRLLLRLTSLFARQSLGGTGGQIRRPTRRPPEAVSWACSGLGMARLGRGRAAAVGVCVSPAACLWPWAVAAPPRLEWGHVEQPVPDQPWGGCGAASGLPRPSAPRTRPLCSQLWPAPLRGLPRPPGATQLPLLLCSASAPSHGGHSRLRPRAACVGRLRSASTRQHVWGHCPPGSPRVRRGSDSVVRGASQATHTSPGMPTRRSGTARGGAERAAERPAVPCGLGGALPAWDLSCPICTQGRRLPRGRGVSGTPGRPP